jgi:hypothetical protein
MRSLTRLLQRLLIFGVGVISVWLIVFVVFDFADQRLPWLVALSFTYGVGAYIILPRAVRMGLKVLHRQRIPSYTVTADGLPGDPVNLVLIGTLSNLRAAYATAGWSEADRLGLPSSWRMIRTFIFNKPYPTAPFSTLYLFGRGQDIGFQKAIDNSPRKRHHIRFWALSLARAEETLGTASFWFNTDPTAGQGTRSLGRCRHKRYWPFADEADFSNYSCNRLGYECGTGFYCCRAEEKWCHWRGKHPQVWAEFAD